MTSTELFIDTVKHYSVDPINRRCIKTLLCRYDPRTLGLEGKSEGCAIGRHMTPENAKIADTSGDLGISLLYESTPELLPEWMQKMEKEFLVDIQCFHDNDDNWNENGLSIDGKQYVNRIIEKYKLDVRLEDIIGVS